jgi:flagellar brake protein
MAEQELSLNQKKFQQLSVPDTDEYRVGSRVEVVRALRGLIQHRAPVNAFFNMDNDMIFTSVIAVDADNDVVYLDYGSNETLNRRMTQGEVTFTASAGSVKLQFSGPKVAIGSYQGMPTFRMPVPTKMLLLQRREFHRIDTPIANPLTCEIPASDGRKVKMALADISVGGISLLIAGSKADEIFEKGAVIPNCKLVVPEAGLLDVTLNVQAFFPITRKDGAKIPHMGCAFVDLPLPLETAIQRYINKLERERNANKPD